MALLPMNRSEYVEAAKWYRLAADRGSRAAQYRLMRVAANEIRPTHTSFLI